MCSSYKGITLNTFQVLAVLRLDYNSLIGTDLQGQSKNFMAQLYFDCVKVNALLLLTARND